MPIQSQYRYIFELGGKLEWPTVKGVVYSGANQAPVGLNAGLTTTYTGGLMLYNPPTSQVALAILMCSASLEVANPAAAILGLGVAASATALGTPGTAVVSANMLVGSSGTPTGVLYSNASNITLPVAPMLVRPLRTVDTGAITTGIGSPGDQFDIGGSIVLEAGSYCCIVMTTASAASSFIGSFTWKEIPQGGGAG